MAASLTHLILAELVYKNYFSSDSKKDFMQGTLLPDIRNLDKNISRDRYHFQNITFDNILAIKNSFQKGIYFHALVDIVRNNFYSSKGIYTPGKNEEFIVSLKLFEDQHFYYEIKNRDEYFYYFQDILYSQIPEIKSDILKKWYEINQNYLLEKPNNRTRTAFMRRLGLLEKIITKINKLIEEISKNKELIAVVDLFYDTFPSLLENHNNIITINTCE